MKAASASLPIRKGYEQKEALRLQRGAGIGCDDLLQSQVRRDKIGEPDINYAAATT